MTDKKQNKFKTCNRGCGNYTSTGTCGSCRRQEEYSGFGRDGSTASYREDRGY